MWQWVLDTIDRVESWLVLLPIALQIPILLVVLVPLAWGVARLIDPVVDWVLTRLRFAERATRQSGRRAERAGHEERQR